MLNHRSMAVVLGLMAAVSGCASKPTNPAGKPIQPVVYSSIPRQYQVRSGDTISGIASRYGLDWRELSARNNLGASHIIYVGQWIDLLSKSVSVGSVPVGYQSQPVPILTPTVKPVSVTPPIKSQLTSPSNNTIPSKFILPVGYAGMVAKGYGLPSGEGVTSGIFFSGQVGVPILASAKGTVIHSDAMTNSANLQRPMVMIQHAGGYVTTYFDVNNITVLNGQNVNQGDKIGSMSSQTLSGAALFEFRMSYNGRYLDPMKMIK